MPVAVSQLRYPKVRALLPRTRLAYVHLQNLLSDAKRDRAARVFGYVAIWLPDELILLYMEAGELANATASADGVHWRALPIAEAVSRVPNAAEYGEICFHQAEDEQLAAMYASQTQCDEPFPPELLRGNTTALLANLMATLYDGAIEILDDGGVSYVIFRHGMPLRAYFADEQPAAELAVQVRTLLDSAFHRGGTVRRWGVPPALPNQAAPALIAAYRELMGALTQHLHGRGASGAFAVAEQARQKLLAQHPCLEKFSLSVPNPRDPVVETPELSAAMADWIRDTLWHVHMPNGDTPEQLLVELARPRRHLFHAAGLFDALPWTLPW